MSGSVYDDRRDAGPADLAAFQSALARLQPAPDGLNLAQLLFRAGQRSERRRSWAWPCAAVASLILSSVLGILLVFRPAPQPAERIITVYVPTPMTPPSPPAPSALAAEETPLPPYQPPSDKDSYLQLRRKVLAHGLDALPAPTPWPAATPQDDAGLFLDLPYDSPEPWLLRLKHALHSGGPL
jgi:hypothetical protein